MSSVFPATDEKTGSPIARFLEGVRVVDLSQYIPGPMATLFLADMGADVIKIEPPQGDEMQKLGPRDRDGRPVFYHAMNAGKRILRLNLKQDSSRIRLLDMIREADVVVEGFRPGVMARLGLSYEVLSGVNPAIVLCSISGYGAGTQMSGKAGHDANYLSLMGMMDRNGAEKPQFFDPPVSDVAGSLFGAIAILGALHGRTRTGKGCAIDLALADTAMPLQMMQVADFGANGTVPRRGGTYLNGGAAYYQVYATGDGRHVILGAIEPKFWAAFCDAAGRPDWKRRQDEALPQTALSGELAAYFSGMTAAEAELIFSAADCCLSLVNDLGEALADPHVVERGLVRQSESGQLQALFPARIDGVAPATRPEPVFMSVDPETMPGKSVAPSSVAHQDSVTSQMRGNVWL